VKKRGGSDPDPDPKLIISEPDPDPSDQIITDQDGSGTLINGFAIIGQKKEYRQNT